jgi:hypothetical protein
MRSFSRVARKAEKLIRVWIDSKYFQEAVYTCRNLQNGKRESATPVETFKIIKGSRLRL